MAGDWIPMRLNLAEDPAIIAVAKALALPEETVVGLFHRLWSWANQQTIDGVAPKVDAVWLDRYLHHPGFSVAAQEAGWLDLRHGALVIPKFDRWNGKSAKARLLNTRRQQSTRKLSRKTRDESATRGEESIEDMSKKNTWGGARPPAAEKPPPDTEPLATPPDRVSGTACDTTAPGAKKPRQPDPLFDAVAAVTASDPKASASYVGRVCKALRAALPPYTPEEVYRFRDNAAKLLPWSNGETLTLGTVEKYIGRVRAAPQPGLLDNLKDFVARGKEEDVDPT